MVKPHEMAWSSFEYAKDSHQDMLYVAEKERRQRLFDRAIVKDKIKADYILDKMIEEKPDDEEELKSIKN